jgi:hypothetical protein
MFTREIFRGSTLQYTKCSTMRSIWGCTKVSGTSVNAQFLPVGRTPCLESMRKKAKTLFGHSAPNWLAELLKTQGNEQDCRDN